MPPFVAPKIYHIVHVDRLPSIIADGSLWCDAEIARRTEANADIGTMIGMNSIKQRRLTELTLDSHPSLYVGQCVPFYFCPRFDHALRGPLRKPPRAFLSWRTRPDLASRSRYAANCRLG